MVTGSDATDGDASTDGEAAGGALEGAGDAPPVQAEIMNSAAIGAASHRFIVSSSRCDGTSRLFVGLDDLR
jgi:hypothetical protein